MTGRRVRLFAAVAVLAVLWLLPALCVPALVRSIVDRHPWLAGISLALSGIPVLLLGWVLLRRGIRRRLAAAREGQRRFAANASHELRTPVSVQRTLVDVAMIEAGAGTEMHRLGEQLLMANDRIERVVDGLLMLARADDGPSVLAPVRLDEVAARVLAELSAEAAARDVTLSADLSEKTVAGERVLLERLVTDLVRNAILYNTGGGVVLVRLGRELVVENTGPVLPAEVVAGLFEPFRRAGPERASHTAGAGLGLSIVRSIATGHGGSVRAGPGARGGLRVSVRLPTRGGIRY
ncbi:HAMP domain-containing sensor histidine kinase [Amycolatopsis sp.]|uniref:sensor histidine kinase n=1 Tax=Amycolatopsis sp. TaxID=37632 RepID=UPI002C135FE6|nr:HAMP domain-containing sensor histidine kinase [Amycolatopsis sp.]HVV07638.1 HAMP domain-containing sensor histidine kinase [Amycolatopsis sp.]